MFNKERINVSCASPRASSSHTFTKDTDPEKWLKDTLNYHFKELIENYVYIPEFNEIINKVNFEEFVELFKKYDVINNLIKDSSTFEILCFIISIISNFKVIWGSGGGKVYNFKRLEEQKLLTKRYKDGYSDIIPCNLFIFKDDTIHRNINCKIDKIYKYNISTCTNFIIDFNNEEVNNKYEYFKKIEKRYGDYYKTLTDKYNQSISGYKKEHEKRELKKDLDDYIENNKKDFKIVREEYIKEYNEYLDLVIKYKKICNY